MNRIISACLAVAGLMAPASATTLPSGEILITQAAVNAGSVTPGDTAGFPVTISVSGSYRLASNLTVTTPGNGIEVRANEVTIDMGGFTLAGSGIGRNGIASFNRTLTVKNGTVRGFTLDGVRTIAISLTVRDMTVTSNGRTGVWADPGLGEANDVSFANIVGSRITLNGGTGVECFADCSVENSVVSRNGSAGLIFRGAGGRALGNTVVRNQNYGIYFFQLGGAGNNVALLNYPSQLSGYYVPMQPNACDPACAPNP